MKHSDSQANFVFFDIKKPYEEVAAKFKREGIISVRSFAPYSTRIRITIGLSEENSKAQQVISHLAR
jgi:histidinol-phosphate aminotransferase